MFHRKSSYFSEFLFSIILRECYKVRYISERIFGVGKDRIANIVGVVFDRI